METIKPAIVLSTHTMGVGVIRSLGIMGVPIAGIYYDMEDMGFVSRYVKERIRAPHPEKSENEFINLLIEIAPRYQGALIIPTNDDTLAAVSRHKEELESYHYIVACTEWEISKRFIDKMYTYALADEIGVPAPKTIVPKSVADLGNYDKVIHYPCLVKPRQSHRYFELFKTKMVQVNDRDQMVSAYRQAADANLDVVIQELIPGDDSQVVNYNSYFWDGRPLVEFTAQQIRKAPPDFGAPRVVISKDIPEVIEPGRNILKAMGFYGYSCIELKRDTRDGIYKLMEVNGRHNRSTLLAVRCGINFPWLQYQHLINGELPVQGQYKSGIYWISLDRDIGYGIKHRKKEKYSLKQYLRPYIHTHVYDYFDWKDMKPFIRRCSNLARSAARRIVHIKKKAEQN